MVNRLQKTLNEFAAQQTLEAMWIRRCNLLKTTGFEMFTEDEYKALIAGISTEPEGIKICKH